MSNWTTHTVVLALLFCWLGSGCKEFLTVEPQDQLSRADLFSTMRGADAAVVGLYRQLAVESYYQFRFPVYADIQGNMAPTTNGGSLDPNNLLGTRLAFVNIHAQTVTPELLNTGMPSFYQQAYTLLFQANDVIDGVSTFTQGSPEQLASLVAEARALRAVTHFDLVRLFAQPPGFSEGATHPGIVLLSDVPGIFDNPARSSVAEVYAAIIADLEAAAADLNPAFSQRSGQDVWLSPTIIYGLLARVNAYARNWEECKSWADQCLGTANQEITPSSSYLAEWRENRVSEALWKIDLQRLLIEVGDTPPNNPDRIIGAGNPEPIMRVNNDLIDLFSSDDLRGDLIKSNINGEMLSEKWTLDSTAIRNTIILRLSEVYLLRAEASVELANLADATADYLTIHRRAVPSGPEPPSDQQGLRQAIRDERRRELAFEGHHFFDLNRWGTDLFRTDCDDAVDRCLLSYPDPKFILPLPFDALLRNPNLLQNPGY